MAWTNQSRRHIQNNPKYKIEPVIDRVAKLTDKYLFKAHSHNESIKQLVKDYNTATSASEDALLRPKHKPRPTLLGILKDQQNTHSKAFLIETRYLEPPTTHNDHQTTHSKSTTTKFIIIDFTTQHRSPEPPNKIIYNKQKPPFLLIYFSSFFLAKKISNNNSELNGHKPSTTHTHNRAKS